MPYQIIWHQAEMKKICTWWLPFILLVCCGMLKAQDESFRRGVEKILQHEVHLDPGLVPSFIVLVQDGYQFAAIDTFGQSLPRGVSDPIYWEIGSLSKPVVAYLVMRALDSLGLTMEASMCSILPDSLCHGNWKEVTIKQVLDHQAGLPLITHQMALAEKDVRDPYADYDVHSLVLDIQQTDPVPGRYSYSHLGYAAFHWLLDKVGGMNAILYKELYMHHAGGISDMVPDQVIVPGHALDGKNTSPWHANAMTPAVGLKSDIQSVCHFMELVRKEIPAEQYLLTRKLKKELAMHDKQKTYKVVQGWFVFRSGKSVVYFHTGHTGGHFVSAAFIPAENKYAIVFSNGVSGTQDLVLYVLDMLRRQKKY